MSENAQERAVLGIPHCLFLFSGRFRCRQLTTLFLEKEKYVGGEHFWDKRADALC